MASLLKIRQLRMQVRTIWTWPIRLVRAGACWSVLLTQRGNKEGSLLFTKADNHGKIHWVPRPCPGCYTVLHSNDVVCIPRSKKSRQTLRTLQNQSNFRCLKAGSIQLCTFRNEPGTELSCSEDRFGKIPQQNTQKRP